MRHQKSKILAEVFGFSDFREGQESIVDTLVAGENVLAVMPTGAGKSLCYQMAALIRPGLTIVVSPLLALMDDQVNALQANGVDAATINSTKSRDEKLAVWDRVTSGKLKLLYLSPEQLLNNRLLPSLQKQDISMFIVDEAHCVSQWGHDFRPEYQRLNILPDMFKGVVIGAFTATADERTRQEIKNTLLGEQSKMVIQGFDRPNIYIEVQQKNNARNQLLNALDKHEGDQGIVYCLSRKSVEKTAEFLRTKGYNALPYHAGMDASVRQNNQELFLGKSDTIIVATIAFGMGIDKPDVRFVIHMDMPSSMEAYYQEIGRAGRDGAPANALMLYGFDNIKVRNDMIMTSGASDAKKSSDRQKLNALISLCETAKCRRNYLLKYFDDPQTQPCGNCDTCLNPPEEFDGTNLATHALMAIRDTRQIFGRGHIIDILTGKENPKIIASNHMSLPSFGAGEQLKLAEWQVILRQMLALDLIYADAEYGSLKITLEGGRVLEGDLTVSLKKPIILKPTRAKKSSKHIQALEGGDQALYDHLKMVRFDLASENKVPAYIVFQDKVLMQMVLDKPSTPDEMLNINGVGPQKLERFGPAFLDAINNFMND